MKYYIIAGEASGDLHASNLIAELKKKDSEAEFRAWGGDLMRKQGVDLVKHYRHTAFMGFVEVAVNFRKVLGNIRECKADLLRYQPDVVILVDYPGFNFRIAEFAHKRGFKVFYYIAPKVWATRERRVKKIKAYVDKLFIVFPFEKEYFDRKGVSYIYRGNPLIDAVDGAAIEPRASLLGSLGWSDAPYIALLAGSRAGEVASMMKIMVAFADLLHRVPGYEDFRFVVAGAPSRSAADYAPYIGGRDYVKVVFGKTYSILAGAEAAVINSGTASLEAVLFGTPQVVGYVASPLTVPLARGMIRIKYVSLGNLIVGRTVFRELLQYYFTPENVCAEVRHILEDKAYREQMLAGYEEIRTLLGGKGASAATARAMIENL
jgi:lipid-A-disaccharide synthase